MHTRFTVMLPCVLGLALPLVAVLGAPAGVRAATALAAQSEKESRTPAQQKIDSQLLQEIYRKRGQAAAKGVPPGKTDVRIDARGRALVDIRATVSSDLTSYIKKIGGAVVSSAPQYRSIIARVPLLKIERLAGRPDVVAITTPSEAELRSPRDSL